MKRLMNVSYEKYNNKIYMLNQNKLLIFCRIIVISLLFDFLLFTNAGDKSIGFFAVIQIIYALYEFKNLNIDYFSLSSLFFYFSVITHCSQYIIYTFNINANIPGRFNMYAYMPHDLVVNTGIFVLCAIQSVLVGLCRASGIIHKKYTNVARNEKKSRKIILLIGVFFIIIGLYPMLYTDIGKILLYMRGGYLETYNQDTSSIIGFLTMLCRLGLVFVILGTKNTPKVSITISAISILYLCTAMLSGNRMNSMIYIILVLLVNYKFIKITSSKLKVIPLCIIGYIVLTLINIIGDMRNTGNSFFTQIMNSEHRYWLSVVGDILGEFGITLSTVCYSLDTFTKNNIIGFGKTYILSFSLVLLNINGFIDQFNNYIFYVNNIPSQYRHALGGSYIGELFFNFHFAGIILAVFVGWLVGFLSYRLDFYLTTSQWIKAAVCLSVVPSVLIWPRGYFQSLIRPFIWTSILILTATFFLKRIHLGKRRYGDVF